MYKYRIDHPYRPVNWRWERARILKELGKSAPGRDKDDSWTKAAASFRKAKDACRNEVEIYQLMEQYPELSMAYELWDEERVNAEGRPNAMRYEIEARILARESYETISKKSGLSVSTLKWYERLFFNVQDRINNRMYIFHQAIGDAIQRGMTDRDYAILWKLYAYVRGPHMLDFLVTTFNDWARPIAGQVESSLLDDHRLTMRRKAALAARMVGINHHSSDRLIELHTKIVEIEKAVGDAAPDGVQHNIQVMLSHLPFLVGKQESTVARSQLANYHGITADLRANELMALSTGGQVVEPSSLNEYKFPEPINGQEANESSGREADDSSEPDR